MPRALDRSREEGEIYISLVVREWCLDTIITTYCLFSSSPFTFLSISFCGEFVTVTAYRPIFCWNRSRLLFFTTRNTIYLLTRVYAIATKFALKCTVMEYIHPLTIYLSISRLNTRHLYARVKVFTIYVRQTVKSPKTWRRRQ